MCLEPAQVGEVGYIGIREAEGDRPRRFDVAVDAFGDCRQIKVVPGCKVVATAVVTVRRAGVRGSKRVGDGLWDIGLEHVDISVGRVWPEVSSSKESTKFGQAQNYDTP